MCSAHVEEAAQQRIAAAGAGLEGLGVVVVGTSTCAYTSSRCDMSGTPATGSVSQAPAICSIVDLMPSGPPPKRLDSNGPVAA